MEKSDKLVALNIRKLRNDLNWTQSELAEKAELSVRGIQAIETEGRIPRSSTVSKIAQALGVAEGLLYIDPNTPRPTTLPKADLLISIYSKIPQLSESELQNISAIIDGYLSTRR